LRDLVRVELVERLALLDRVSFGLAPAGGRAGPPALPEPRQAHISSQVVPLLYRGLTPWLREKRRGCPESRDRTGSDPGRCAEEGSCPVPPDGEHDRVVDLGL